MKTNLKRANASRSQSLASLLPAADAIDNYPDLEEFVVDRSGAKVDTSGDDWVLNVRTGRSIHIPWSQFPIKNAWIEYVTKFFFCEKIKSLAPKSIMGFWYDLLFIRNHYHGALDQLNTDELSNALPQYLHAFLEYCRDNDREYRFARVRQWFVELAELGFPGFNIDQARLLSEIKVKGNPKGVAVKMHDPLMGALDPQELASLEQALTRYAENDALLEGVTVLSLLVALGTEPTNLATLCQDDFIVNEANQSKPQFFLKVPRIKKRGVPLGDDYRLRALTPRIGTLTSRLIEHNKQNYPVLPDNVKRPIFFNHYPEGRSNITDADTEYRFHSNGWELYMLVKNTVRHLGVYSARTGQPLYLTPRRLRYTFATVAASTGISEDRLAKLLDHSDVQNVQVYYEAADYLVDKLDVALAETHGKVIQWFLGDIIDDSESISDEAKLFAQPGTRELILIGGCGRKEQDCECEPPYTCYPCPQFHALKDVDHKAVLKKMLAERETRLGADERNRGIDYKLDPSIIACANLCHRLDENKDDTKC